MGTSSIENQNVNQTFDILISKFEKMSKDVESALRIEGGPITRTSVDPTDKILLENIGPLFSRGGVETPMIPGYGGYSTYSNSSSEVVVQTFTIENGRLGTKGGFLLGGSGLFFNNASGGLHNARVRVRYGGLLGTLIADTGNIGVVNNGNLHWMLDLREIQSGGAASQLSIARLTYSTITGTTLGASTTTATAIGTGKSFAADVDVVITAQWDAAAATLIHYLILPTMFGPYYAT